MSAGRRRIWWRHLQDQRQETATTIEQEKEEEETDGRLESEGCEGRVPSTGYAKSCD